MSGDTQVKAAKRDFTMAVLDILGREDMTQADLARACKLTHPQLAQFLHQQPNSTLRTLCRIAGGLGYRVRIILEKNNDL